jgi:phosphoribosylamine--glycine ligase
VVVGPEAPLVAGIREYFAQDPELKNVLLVGPGKEGARLEGSKDFSKSFMLRHQIPTAKARTFSRETLEEGKRFIAEMATPVVLKADGLAAGKGVIISPTHAEAQAALEDMLVNETFGQASAKVLVEEYLDGIELSVFVLTDGKDYLILPEAKDYKRIGEGDTGLNTGGMGAVSPVYFADKVFMHKVEERVVKRTLAGLQEEGIPYQGFLFIGLMKVKDEPYVIEYNVRMGDPETQAVIPRIENDLLEILRATARGELGSQRLRISPKTAATVVMVAGGYPGAYAKGDAISGLEHSMHADIFTFHAGTKAADKTVLTNGGRVLALTALANSLPEALGNVYAGLEKISWKDVYFRRDIGKDILR